MSQRAILRGSFLCILSLLVVVAVVPAEAQTNGGTITFSPATVPLSVGEVSGLITAQVAYAVGTTAPTGTQTLTFPYMPYGITTVPSTVSFTVPTGQLTATVSFRLAAAPYAWPGNGETPVYGSPAPAYGLLNYFVNGLSLAPSSLTVAPGSTSGSVTATVSFATDGPPTGPQQLVFRGLPSGATPVPSPVSFLLQQQSWTTVTFRIAVAAGTVPGSYGVIVTTSPTPSGDDSFTLVVTNPGGVTLSLAKPELSVCPGGAAVANSVTVTPFGGYAGTMLVTFPLLPSELSITPAQVQLPAIPPAQTATFSVSAKPGALPGTKTVVVRAEDSAGIGATTTFVVNVGTGDYTPAVSPPAITLSAGGAPATITASLAPGACPPASSITVVPSGLPAGVTVNPASAVLAPPAFGPAAFSFQANASALPGPSTVTFTYSVAGASPKTTTAVITVCGPPAAPVSPVIRPQGNPNGPVTATDFLTLQWGAPAAGFAPTRYEWRLNGGAWTSAAGLTASAPPRGTVDPVQLFVRGWACSPERGPGPEASSPTYSLAPPAANFSVPASVVAGQAVTFTDTSSPQATSWLWFPGDGMTATTVQSPTVTFPAAGPKVVVLVAANGSGSSSKATTVNVLPASSVRAATGLAVRSMDREPDGRLSLGQVEVAAGTALLLRRLEGDGEAVAFLRLVDADGRVVVERRLVLAEGEEARHDLSAFATGTFRVEVVGPEGLEAAVEESVLRLGEPEPGTPVAPRRPGAVRIR